MEEGGADAFLACKVSNMRYLTGFEGVFDDAVNAACLVTSTESVLYTDFRYAEAATEAAEGTGWEVRLERDSLYCEICDDFDGAFGMVAVEGSIPYGRFKFISERCDGRVAVKDQWVEEIRQTKDPPEVERIAQAAALTDEAFEHILGFARAGLTEREIALELEWHLRTHGSEGIAFEPIVASGPNSARPHARPTDRRLTPGDLVVLDFGARVGDYCSDMTRTLVVGEADEKQTEVYRAVLEASEAALAAVRVGIPCADLDGVARSLLETRGLGDEFGHSLGHGVGLDVHELPRLGRKAQGVVEGGTVVTIEPGVYLPGVGGVRIEDLVLVEGGGYRLLSHAPKDLVAV
jgi:Xaa-Pro aminopeptidase